MPEIKLVHPTNSGISLRYLIAELVDEQMDLVGLVHSTGSAIVLSGFPELSKHPTKCPKTCLYL